MSFIYVSLCRQPAALLHDTEYEYRYYLYCILRALYFSFAAAILPAAISLPIFPLNFAVFFLPRILSYE